MKTLAAKEKRPASAKRKTHPPVHSPLNAKSRIQRDRIRQILQPKLIIGRPNDKYEQEADRVADRVVANQPVPEISSIAGSPSLYSSQTVQADTVADDYIQEKDIQPQPTEEEEEPVQTKLIQRQPEEEEEEPVQAKLIQLQPEEEEEEEPVQTKLIQRQPEEEEEEEPVQANLIQLQPEEEEEEPVQTKLIQRQVEEEEEEPVQAKLIQLQPEEEEEEPVQTKLIQRQPEEEEEEPVQPKLIQRQSEEEEEDDDVQASGSIPSTHAASQAINNPSSSSPMRADIRSRLESGMGVDLSGVRVHEDSGAHKAAASIKAKAFTHKNDIWLGAGQSQSELHLMAHESTHVVQQGATSQTSSAVTQSKSSSASIVQRDERPAERGLLGRIWDVGGRLLDFGADVVWGLLRERAPQLATLLQDIRRVGILGYLRERIGDAFSRVFSRLRANNEVVARLFQIFDIVMAQAAVIIEGLRSGSCRPLFAAIDRMKQAISDVAGDAWSAITEFFRPVGDFFADVWQRFGAPVVEWIQDVAGDVWEFITGLGRQIWDWMEPVRSAFSDAWEWVKRQLGIGQDEGNDQGGLIHWIREKAGEAWRAIRETLEPVMAPIRGVVNRIREILPLDAIVNLRDTVTGWLSNVSNMTQQMEQENGVANQQTSLRQDILPGVLRSIRRLRDGIVRAGRWVAGHIGNLADTIQGFFGGLSRSTLLRPVTALLQWVPDRVQQLNQWAQSTVRRLFEFLGNGLVYLSQFIEPVLNTLQKVVEVLGDLMGKISELVFGRFWRMIPRCIRDPIKNFIVERILSNIPIFGQLLRIPNIWERVQDTAMRILRQVFVTGDLAGAAWTFFREVLNLINIPAQLVTGIISKAATALGDILRDPIGFLMNLVRGMVRGILQFCRNIGRHMLSGISGWLFGQLQQAGIHPPADFSLRSILGFVLQVLDITRERIFRRMERHPRIGRERVARLRRIIDRLTGVWQWVSVLIREGPAGLWRMLRERLSNLWETVLNSIITWISTRVISRALARLATMADPTGIGAVINIIVTVYQAIQTAAQYARQILEAVNRFLDGINNIAQGALGPAANFLENALARLLPAAIGFIANWVGLGGLGRRIREMVERIRAQVDRAIDWLIERGVRTIDAVLRGVRAVGRAIRRGAQRVIEWWRFRRTFRTRQGESHSLYISGSQENPRIMVASSTPMEYNDFLAHADQQIGRIIQRDPNARDLHSVKQQAGRQFLSIARDINRARRDPSRNAALIRDLRDLSGRTRALLNRLYVSGASIPTRVTYLGGHPHFGVRMIAAPLTLVGPPGSQPSAENPVWNTLGQRLVRRGSYYVRGHLLNTDLHGPGNTWQNLTPLTQSANSRHESSVESKVKRDVRQGKIVDYRVESQYGRSVNDRLRRQIDASSESLEAKSIKGSIVEAEQFVPQRLRCQAYELDPNNLDRRVATIVETTVENNIRDGHVTDYRIRSVRRVGVNLNTDNRVTLQNELPGIGPAGALVLITLRRQRPFADIRDARIRYLMYREEENRSLNPNLGPWSRLAGAPPYVVEVS